MNNEFSNKYKSLREEFPDFSNNKKETKENIMNKISVEEKSKNVLGKKLLIFSIPTLLIAVVLFFVLFVGSSQLPIIKDTKGSVFSAEKVYANEVKRIKQSNKGNRFCSTSYRLNEFGESSSESSYNINEIGDTKGEIFNYQESGSGQNTTKIQGAITSSGHFELVNEHFDTTDGGFDEKLLSLIISNKTELENFKNIMNEAGINLSNYSSKNFEIVDLVSPKAIDAKLTTPYFSQYLNVNSELYSAPIAFDTSLLTSNFQFVGSDANYLQYMNKVSSNESIKLVANIQTALKTCDFSKIANLISDDMKGKSKYVKVSKNLIRKTTTFKASLGDGKTIEHTVSVYIDTKTHSLNNVIHHEQTKDGSYDKTTEISYNFIKQINEVSYELNDLQAVSGITNISVRTNQK